MEHLQAKYCNYNLGGYVGHTHDGYTEEVKGWNKHVFPVRLLVNWELDTIDLSSRTDKPYGYRHSSTNVRYLLGPFA